MRRALARSARIVIVAAGLLLSAPDSHADDVATLKADARALAERGEYPAAVQKLRVALSLQRSHDIAGNLGLVEARAELWVPAIEHIQLALELLPPSAKPEVRDALEKTLGEAKTKVAELTIRVDRPGASVLVDGASVGTAPLARPVYVEARRHAVMAELRGDKSSEVIVIPGVGTRGVVDLAIAPGGAAGAEPAPVAASTIAEAEPTGFDAARPWLAVGSGTLLVGGLVTGIAFTLVSNGYASDAESLTKTLPNGTCAPGGDGRTCLEIGGNLGQADGTSTTAVFGFVIAGIGAVGLATVLLVPASDNVAIAVGAGRAEARVRFR